MKSSNSFAETVKLWPPSPFRPTSSTETCKGTSSHCGHARVVCQRRTPADGHLEADSRDLRGIAWRSAVLSCGEIGGATGVATWPNNPMKLSTGDRTGLSARAEHAGLVLHRPHRLGTARRAMYIMRGCAGEGGATFDRGAG
eukprot:scaffold48_cov395-Prasinococcus_capsulatus_cf.AAC.17